MQDSASPPPPDGPTGPRASATVARHLADAVEAIDAVFGEGHARANPALVAAFIQACAIEQAVAAGREASERTLETVRHLSRETNETILKLKPRLFG